MKARYIIGAILSFLFFLGCTSDEVVPADSANPGSGENLGNRTCGGLPIK